MDDFKKCSHCGAFKHISNFYKDAKAPGKRKSKCIDCLKSSSIKSKYGISNSVYKAMLKGQEYKCLICHSETELVIDHCHENGHVRGLICSNCNKALGLLRDDVESLDRAIRYLKDI
jgi:hypothetical protein